MFSVGADAPAARRKDIENEHIPGEFAASVRFRREYLHIMTLFVRAAEGAGAYGSNAAFTQKRALLRCFASRPFYSFL